MTYAYRKVENIISASHLNDEIFDFLVNDCGWTDKTPTGQDDQNGMILGRWLRSPGEDGIQDIHMHLHLRASDYAPWPQHTYLNGAIDDVVTTIPIKYDSTFPTAGRGRVGDELIQWTGVSGGNLTGCTRGLYGSTPASHSLNDVLLVLADDVASKNFKTTIEVFAHSDLTKDLLASSGVASIGAQSVSSVPGLSGYGDDRFNYHALLKVTDGAEAGKMRWVQDYTSAGGDFDFTRHPFLTAPGSANCELVSQGFFPGWTARADMSTGSNRGSKWGTIPPATFGSIAWTVYLYGNLNNFAAVAWRGDLDKYYFTFFGIPNIIASPLVVGLTSAAAAGDWEVEVNDIGMFSIDQRIRLLSQDVDDWADNEDRQVSDGWDPLDPEETASEENIVRDIDVGNRLIKLEMPLIYSYRVGAVVGEDPRPTMRYSAQHYNEQLLNRNDTQYSGVASCYSPSDAGRIFRNASHRQNWRAYHADLDPKTIRGNYEVRPVYLAKVASTNFMYPVQFTNITDRQNSQYPVHPVILFAYRDTEMWKFGWEDKVAGTVPWVWYIWSNIWGASAGDRVRMLWGASYRWFRVIEEYNSVLYLVGPEEAA